MKKIFLVCGCIVSLYIVYINVCKIMTSYEILSKGKLVTVEVTAKDNCDNGTSDQIKYFKFSYKGTQHTEFLNPVYCDSFSIGSKISLYHISDDKFLFPVESSRDEKAAIVLFLIMFIAFFFTLIKVFR